MGIVWLTHHGTSGPRWLQACWLRMTGEGSQLAEDPQRRSNRKWMAVAAFGSIATITAVVVGVGQDDQDECQDLQRQIDRIEQENTLDATQAWEDIHGLRAALTERLRLRNELRDLGCP